MLVDFKENIRLFLKGNAPQPKYAHLFFFLSWTASSHDHKTFLSSVSRVKKEQSVICEIIPIQHNLYLSLHSQKSISV